MFASATTAPKSCLQNDAHLYKADATFDPAIAGAIQVFNEPFCPAA
jgi:hypothetical protein